MTMFDATPMAGVFVDRHASIRAFETRAVHQSPLSRKAPGAFLQIDAALCILDA